MNKANRSFLMTLGWFLVLWGVILSATGYWTSLQKFGVSERFFHVLTIFSFVGGGGSLVIALLARPAKKPE